MGEVASIRRKATNLCRCHTFPPPQFIMSSSDAPTALVPAAAEDVNAPAISVAAEAAADGAAVEEPATEPAAVDGDVPEQRESEAARAEKANEPAPRGGDYGGFSADSICRDYCRNKCAKRFCKFGHPHVDAVVKYRIDQGWDAAGPRGFGGNGGPRGSNGGEGFTAATFGVSGGGGVGGGGGGRARHYDAPSSSATGKRDREAYGGGGREAYGGGSQYGGGPPPRDYGGYDRAARGHERDNYVGAPRRADRDPYSAHTDYYARENYARPAPAAYPSYEHRPYDHHDPPRGAGPAGDRGGDAYGRGFPGSRGGGDAYSSQDQYAATGYSDRQHPAPGGYPSSSQYYRDDARGSYAAPAQDSRDRAPPPYERAPPSYDHDRTQPPPPPYYH
jgi:hypothetical protein